MNILAFGSWPMPRNMALVGKSQTFPVFRFRSLSAVTSFWLDVEDIFHHRVGEELDLLVLARAVQHDLGSAELFAPMNDRHLGGKAR